MALFRRGYVRGGIILLLVVSLVLLWAAPCFAVAIADDILVAVVLAFLAASGVTLSFASGGASQSDVVGVMMGKLGEFATAQGSSIADLFPAAGAWFANGFISVTQSVGNALSGFLSWLQGADVGLSSNTIVSIQDGGTYWGDLRCFSANKGFVFYYPRIFPESGKSNYVFTISSYTCPDLYISFALDSNGYANPIFLSSGYGNVKYSRYYDYGDGNVQSPSNYTVSIRNTNISGVYAGYYNMERWGDNPSHWCTIDLSWDPVNFLSPLNIGGSVSSVPDIGIGADTITSLPPIESGYDVVIGSPAIGADVDTLQGAADDVLGHVVENAGDLTGNLEVVEQGTVTPPGPDEPEHEDNYPVVGLETIFPFCIPFDLYEFFSVLDADPVAPSFTWTADFPDALGGPQEITIDFDTPEWNAAARVLRTLELLAFIVGLMVITRKLIRG